MSTPISSVAAGTQVLLALAADVDILRHSADQLSQQFDRARLAANALQTAIDARAIGTREQLAEGATT